MTIIDCTQIDVKDFAEIESTVSHTGYHPTILLHCAQALNFEEIMQPLTSFQPVDMMQLVVFVSRRGTHRAVAALDLVDHAVEWLHYCFDDTSIRLESRTIYALEQELEKKSVETIHLNSDRWSHICRGDCDECMLMFHWTAEEFVYARRIRLHFTN